VKKLVFFWKNVFFHSSSLFWFSKILKFRKIFRKISKNLISCRWKFLLFFSKKNIFEDEPWPDFKNKFFLHPFRWNFCFSEKCSSRRNQNFKKNFLILLRKFVENFFFIFVEKNFSKMTFPPPSNVGNNFFEKMKIFFKKNRSSSRDIEKNVIFSKHEQHKWPTKLSVPGMNFFEMARQIRVKEILQGKSWRNL